jgi:hypothetical protein
MAAYKIEQNRLVAVEKLSPSDFDAIGLKLGAAPLRAQKVGLIAGRPALEPQVIETRWNGKESTNTADPGDWIVTTLSDQGVPIHDSEGHLNTYVIEAGTFPNLYDPTNLSNEIGDVFRPRATVSALWFSGGFDIVAPWGERQSASAGYLLKNGNDVYGNHKDTFDATYRVLPAAD